MNYNSKGNFGLYRQRIADYRGRMNQILLYYQSLKKNLISNRGSYFTLCSLLFINFLRTKLPSISYNQKNHIFRKISP